MTRALRHIIQLTLAFCLLLTASSCDKDTLSAEDIAENGKVVLVLNAGITGSTRAGVLPDNEKMKTLRIVILHPDGTVEHNEHIDFGATPVEQYVKFIPVTRNETKAVYLFANEESVNGLTAELSAFIPGSTGFQARVENMDFEPDYATHAIPMTSKYEVEVKDDMREYQFYLVHAATKFTFRFRNMRTGPVTVNSIAVSEIADRMYVMPHKQIQTMDFEEADGSTSSLYWIDWLQRVAEESEANPDNPVNTELAERRGWIMDYDIPAGATHGSVTHIPTMSVVVPKAGTNAPGTAEYPAFYLPESRKLKATGGGSYGEQAYTMAISLRDDNNRLRTFDMSFNNLKALFRNTHVIVDVLFNENIQVTLRYTVCPMNELVSNIPDFS